MNCRQAFFISVIFASTTLIALSYYHSMFKLFCERMAKLEGKEKEFQSLRSFDDGGMNMYELEQYEKLWKSKYKAYHDEKLDAIASKLLRGGYIGTLLIIATAGWIFLTKFLLCT